MSERGAVVAAKLAKAEEFLVVARLVQDEAYDAAVSLAVTAAINASDVILITASGAASSAPHEQAVHALRRAGFSSQATQLQRSLSLKSPAQYFARRCTRLEADQAVKRAERLLEQAQVIALGRQGPRND